MRKKEQKLWDAMREAGSARHVYMERVENAMAAGRPDVDVLCGGRFTPCELKAVLGWPARAKTRVLGDDGLRQEQKNWHMEWARHGGRSLIIVGVGLGALRTVWAFHGKKHDQINEYTLTDFHAEACAVGWDEIFKELLPV